MSGEEQAGGSARTTAGRQIFVLGLMQRSGTNFVANLLDLHPDTVLHPHAREDFLLKHAHLLRRYTEAVSTDWSTNWWVPPEEEQHLLRHIGGGLEGWLARHSDGRRVVTKTPNVANLELFPELFPDACLIILVRDGRAVVESGVRSFDWHYGRSIRRWAAAAEAALTFDATHRSGPVRCRIVRYEDLLGAPPQAVADLLAHCDLDPTRYDFAAAAKLPVVGSSQTRQATGTTVHWRPEDRPAGFDPRGRAAGWDEHRQRTFERYAGPVARALGYDVVPAGRPPVRTVARNTASDLNRAARRKLRVARGRGIDRLPDPDLHRR